VNIEDLKDNDLILCMEDGGVFKLCPIEKVITFPCRNRIFTNFSTRNQRKVQVCGDREMTIFNTYSKKFEFKKTHKVAIGDTFMGAKLNKYP